MVIAMCALEPAMQNHAMKPVLEKGVQHGAERHQAHDLARREAVVLETHEAHQQHEASITQHYLQQVRTPSEDS